ncbi:hypothetical protein BDA96_08G092000 [Sorghum bicolor]|uniref:Uncharacterized protein n=2 Tax=Sorghum bicolor TaxID=4558 RepID=A0A921U6J6_SORBI|nr:hypothetical protein BDA96_08G092000 [Sorghum bicolor]KXG23339.1 hypothetical protein SORBI_3008G085400 [Sorghum bicolor]
MGEGWLWCVNCGGRSMSPQLLTVEWSLVQAASSASPCSVSNLTEFVWDLHMFFYDSWDGFDATLILSFRSLPRASDFITPQEFVLHLGTYIA